MIQMSPAEYVIQVFGGVRATGRAIGRDATSVFLWKGNGRIPTANLRKILKVAKLKKLDITAEDLILGRSFKPKV